MYGQGCGGGGGGGGFLYTSDSINPETDRMTAAAACCSHNPLHRRLSESERELSAASLPHPDSVASDFHHVPAAAFPNSRKMFDTSVMHCEA